MYIKGSQSGSCNMCEYGYFDPEKEVFLCMAKKEETQKDDTCRKFKFDIHKYEPKKRLVFGRFSEKDFEI